MILHDKWQILTTCEFLAWLFVFAMFYARYWKKSRRMFLVSSAAEIVTGIVPQISLMVYNLAVHQTFDVFDGVVILLFAYGLTLGRKHIQRIDQWMLRRATNRENASPKNR